MMTSAIYDISSRFIESIDDSLPDPDILTTATLAEATLT